MAMTPLEVLHDALCNYEKPDPEDGRCIHWGGCMYQEEAAELLQRLADAGFICVSSSGEGEK